jgi:hypothetical protein
MYIYIHICTFIYGDAEPLINTQNCIKTVERASVRAQDREGDRESLWVCAYIYIYIYIYSGLESRQGATAHVTVEGPSCMCPELPISRPIFQLHEPSRTKGIERRHRQPSPLNWSCCVDSTRIEQH